MKKETLEALKASIGKWEGIVASTEVDRGFENCALCQRFSKTDCKTPDGSETCPVALKAKDDACENTPYMDWHAHGVDAHKTTNSPDSEGYKVHSDCPECLRLAKAELRFLKSLLPKGKTEREVLSQKGDRHNAAS